MTLISGLTDEQRAAIEALDQGVSLSAAAGSGKTTVLVERYLRLLSRGVLPSQILTVTFTVEAAQQLKRRIQQRLDETESSEELKSNVASSRFIGTLHSFCFLVLDGYGSLLNLPPIQSILDPFEFHAIFDRYYREWQEGLSAEDFATLLSALNGSELKELARTLYDIRHDLPPLAGDTLSDLTRLLAPLLQRVETHFFAQGIFSFNDLESLTLRLLNEFPTVAEKWRTQFKHICVDEFQDTSRAQWEILRRLIGDAYRKLFVVGDPKQSIYRFRQADVSLFSTATAQIVAAGGEALQLTANFRSAPGLLKSINAVSDHLFAGSTFAEPPMRSGNPAAPEGQYLIHRYPAEKKNAIASEIKAVAHYVDKLCSQVKPADIALLFRVSDRIPDYARALSECGIAVRAKKTQSLFASPSIRDLHHYLRAVANPLHDFSMAAFLRSPYVGWSYQRLYDLQTRTGESLFEKLQSSPDSGLVWFFRVIEEGVYSVQAALNALFRGTGKWPGESDAFLELLGPLLEAGDLNSALGKMALWERADIPFTTRTGDDHAVALLTVHAAKGLEFPYVLMVDNLRLTSRRAPVLRTEPGTRPALKFRVGGEPVENEDYKGLAQLQNARDDEEAKRVLYVALTRAERQLTVFLPEDRSLIPSRSWGNILDKI